MSVRRLLGLALVAIEAVACGPSGAAAPIPPSAASGAPPAAIETSLPSATASFASSAVPATTQEIATTASPPGPSSAAVSPSAAATPRTTPSSSPAVVPIGPTAVPATTVTPPSPNTAGAPATASVEIVARGLDTPWALAFAPDGRIFVTERPGRIRVIQNGALLAEPWATLAVSEMDGAERGLMGIAVDPDFARNGFVYVAYTYRSGTRDVNRLVRLRDAGGRGVDETILLDGVGGGDNHDGGRVKIGPDGKLWWAVGEAGGPANVAQLPDRLNGKILRLERDGSVPADNPVRGSYVWSMGHRNPQGLAWHPDSGALYATEHGPSMNGTSFCCHDEVNLIVPGGNYGWPTVWGVSRDPRFLDPVFESGPTTTWAPAGATFITRGTFRGSLLFGTLAGQHLHRLVFSADGRTVVYEERLLVTTYGRLRDVVEAPDGSLYVLTSNRDGRAFPKPDDDKVLRVVLR